MNVILMILSVDDSQATYFLHPRSVREGVSGVSGSPHQEEEDECEEVDPEPRVQRGARVRHSQREHRGRHSARQGGRL